MVSLNSYDDDALSNSNKNSSLLASYPTITKQQLTITELHRSPVTTSSFIELEIFEAYSNLLKPSVSHCRR